MPFHRIGAGPWLSPGDLPALPGRWADPSGVFNPGALVVDGRIELLLRLQSRGRETALLSATSADGLHVEVDSTPLAIDGLAALPGRVHHVYDPRLTLVDGVRHALVAVDLDARCALALLRSEDGRRWNCRKLVDTDAPDVRNGVLFPARVGGRHLMLDRPNSLARDGLAGGGDAIRLLASADLLHWRPVGEIARGRPRRWDERIGAGPPPLLTEAGWLLVYHGVATHFGSASLYQAGVMLLDAERPERVLARGRNNVLEPRESWEQVGQVPNVVFPSGLVLPDRDPAAPAPRDARVLLYYGAADTCIGLAESTIGELLDDCEDSS